MLPLPLTHVLYAPCCANGPVFNITPSPFPSLPLLCGVQVDERAGRCHLAAGQVGGSGGGVGSGSSSRVWSQPAGGRGRGKGEGGWRVCRGEGERDKRERAVEVGGGGGRQGAPAPTTPCAAPSFPSQT
jgi:hypothetical protein